MALLLKGEKECSTMRLPVKGFLGQGVREEGLRETDEGAWATFGPAEEGLEEENWAKGLQKDQSHDFSCSGDALEPNWDSWEQFHTDRTGTKRLDDEEEGWQDFSTASGEFAEDHCSLLTASVNLGSHLDSVEMKPQSVSLPFEPERKSSSLTESSSAVFRETFHASSDLHTDGSCVVSLASLQSHVNQSFWLCLASRACLPEHLSQPHTASEDRLIELLLSNETSTLATTTSGTGSPSELGRGGGGVGEESEGFDWSIASDRKSPVSPDLLPSFFRPKPASPVNIEFDHSKAAMGLAMLSVSELRSMCEEMRAKFQRLSGVLVSELQLRDQQAHKLDVRNRFISAMLHVQNRRHGFAVNGSMESGLLRGRTWSRSARGKEEKNSGKFLYSIIPYRTPEGLDWSVSTLQQLTSILQAIAEDSDTVPSLVSDYMQSEVLVSPVEERSFQDPEPDLSTSSV